MSNDVTKVALRLHLPQLTGKTWTEAWKFVKPILGDKDVDLEEEEGEVHWFGYPEFVFHKMDNDWYVDYILAESLSYVNTAFTIPDLKSKAAELALKFGLAADPDDRYNLDKVVDAINFIVVDWYGGTDEPFIYKS